MKNTKYLKITFALLLLITFSSCDEFLSEIPDNRTQIDTPEKISEVLVNAYPQASYLDLAETMSDNVGDGELATKILRNEQNYNWETNTETNWDTETFYWAACYNAIAHANQALKSIEQLGNPASLNPQKGEALVARAYAHFMLVSFWSNRYNPATASTDLGIPYVREPETELIKSYKRNTVKEVFDFIEEDLEEGLKHVTNNYKQPRFHFNIDAARSFASRFYLVKGDWDKVLEVSESLGSKPVGKLKDYATLSSLAPDIQFIEYGRSTYETNLLIVSASSRLGRSASTFNFYLSDDKQTELFRIQTNPFNKNWLFDFYSYNSSRTLFTPKFEEYFKYTNLTANIGEPYVGIVLASNDEFYLNRIEALVMKGRIAEANTELEYFLGTRTTGYNPNTDKLTEAKVVSMYPVIADEYTPFYQMTPVQTSYVKAIAEAKRRDFVHEGLRWFDIKRFNIVVEHATFGKPVNKLVKDDKRRALQIPLSASNYGVEKNPR
ncbi:RagB/SusD family nutrient uptake outer membrane protein [Flavobacterium foetidum]|uniref:RagB/SusD family nutrient uptake outer membrane protein n=1 Tax=Flavobacterium foetidum TaxID=2026681 RepID=UPI001074D92B|nr:RagB/SusD family nutrient uptake outer membrane protein [Flavobacterium foetidum]KAF2513790.1 RagB/SusD family nutrient uptake outer membrane protein [Flavobacterium foetidum]